MSLWDDYRDEYEYERSASIDRFEASQMIMYEALEKKTWIKKDGSEIPIEDMSDSHINNCIRLLKNNDNYKYIEDCVERKYVDAFEAELKRRNEKNQA